MYKAGVFGTETVPVVRDLSYKAIPSLVPGYLPEYPGTRPGGSTSSTSSWALLVVVIYDYWKDRGSEPRTVSRHRRGTRVLRTFKGQALDPEPELDWFGDVYP